MDWGKVTYEELNEAMREVDWSSPPRPLSEFFTKFTFPCSYPKWNRRFKCNLFYYRTNYFIMIVLILVSGMGFLMSQLAIIAALMTALSIAFLNDRFFFFFFCSFAGTFNEKNSPHLAAKMRPPLTLVIRGPSAKRAIHICGWPRWVFVFVSSIVSFILWFVSCGILIVLLAFAIGLLAIFIHASFRTPYLLARLNTFQEELRAVSDNYCEL
ncbi:hypothetical protein DH2020_046018 [Rehmannia glutinosa]|uniref:PRA1 family protein n=1 Tax=Rehmannia glutinosa TaxID=99300 RepID=A0ABR0UDC6_REHGL